MKRLRRHFFGKPAERLQNAVVSECRNDFIDLIEVYCATLADVATAVCAEGPPPSVLRASLLWLMVLRPKRSSKSAPQFEVPSQRVLHLNYSG